MELSVIEILSVLCSIAYLVLLMKKNRWCWLFGITGSALGVYLMLDKQLPAQAIIYSYYVIIGIYGWWHWQKTNDVSQTTYEWKRFTHVLLNLLAIVVGYLAAHILMQYTNTAFAYEDALLTSYGFVASFMQARKILSNWVYWFIIDAVSAVVYYQSGLALYALLMLLYCALCMKGFMEWRKNLAISPSM
jgi:nicotinamide mononucleotide transporter